MKAGSCAALLLAGGESRRMGFPKALAEIDGRPLWRIQVEKLQRLAPPELFLSAPRDLELPESKAWKIIHDETPNLGPLAGLDAARRAMTADWLLVLAVDLPRLPADYLARLRDRAFVSGFGQVPELDGCLLGLAAIYPRTFLESHLESHLQNGSRSVQRFVRDGLALGALVSCPVPETERLFFQNVNAPDDLPPGALAPSRSSGDSEG